MKMSNPKRLGRRAGAPAVARAARVAVEAVEPRILFHFFVADPLPDVSVATGTPASTVDLTGTIDSDEITGSVVRFQTTNGAIDVALYDAQKPLTVANFLGYVNAGKYDGTLVHNVKKQADDGRALLQGGGYAYPGFADISPTGTPAVPNEFSTNGVRSNVRGTIGMAKVEGAADAPNSATSEWYINTADNSAALDNPANLGGLVVFGEVISNTIGVADEIQALPTYNFTGPFADLPLRNYTREDFDAATVLTGDNPVIVSTARTLPETTYAAASSNPGLVTAAVEGNQLTLNYAAGAVGSADVTVTGTGLDGTVLTDTFTVTVGALAVTIGDGAARSVTFTDADGTVGTVSLKGGTATLNLDGAGLTQAAGKRGVAVSGAVGSVSSVVLNGTNGASTLTVKASGGDGVLNVGSITGAGGLRTLAGRQLAVTGPVNLGTAGKVDFGSLNNADVTIGGSVPVAMSVAGAVTASDVTSTPAIRSLKVGGAYDGNLTAAAGLGSAKVGGAVTGGTWNVGGAGALTAGGDWSSDLSVGTLRSLKAGSISNADVVADAALGRITTGNVTGSRFLAAAAPGAFPDGAEDLAAGGIVQGVTVRGTFANSVIAADSVGRLNLGTVTTANNGTAFGVAGNRIAGVTARDTAGASIRLTNLTDSAQSYDNGDFEVRVPVRRTT